MVWCYWNVMFPWWEHMHHPCFGHWFTTILQLPPGLLQYTYISDFGTFADEFGWSLKSLALINSTQVPLQKKRTLKSLNLLFSYDAVAFCCDKSESVAIYSHSSMTVSHAMLFKGLKAMYIHWCRFLASLWISTSCLNLFSVNCRTSLHDFIGIK